MTYKNTNRVDANHPTGYIVDMEGNSDVKTKRKRPRRLFGFLATLAWVLPCMGIMLVAGFFLARDVIAPHLLEKSEFRPNLPKPKRILTTEEGREMLRSSEESHVWTKGVLPSDIPKPTPSEEQQPRRTRQQTTEPAVGKKPAKTITDPTVAPPTAPPPANNTVEAPAPAAPPTTGGGAAETPQ